MKKLITVILILALILPAAALAADGDSPFFGKWVGEEHHAIKHYDTTLHYIWIHQNGPCSYIVFKFFHGGGMMSPKSEEPEMYAGSWKIVDDHLSIPTSPITFVEVYYDAETDTLRTEDPSVTYVRIP